MDCPIKATKSQLCLDALREQLVSDDIDLLAATKPWLRSLAFETFRRSKWPLAKHYPHVQIGTRVGLPVYLFSRLDAIVTIAHHDIPALQKLRSSRETLQDVELFVPFKYIDEWKTELSGELSRGFRVLMRYLFLLHAAENGMDGYGEESLDVAELKKTLMRCVRGSNISQAESTIPQRLEEPTRRSLHSSNFTEPGRMGGSDNNMRTANTTHDLARSTDWAQTRSFSESIQGPFAATGTCETGGTRTFTPQAPQKGTCTANKLSTAPHLKRKLRRNDEDSSDEENSHSHASSRRNVRWQPHPAEDVNANVTAKNAPLDPRSGSREVPILVSEHDDYNDETDVDSVTVSTKTRRADKHIDKAARNKISRVDMRQKAQKTATRSKEVMGNAQLMQHPVKNRNEPKQMLPAGIESAAALHEYLGVEGIALIHQNTNFAIRVRRGGHPAIVPLGVSVGTLLHDKSILVNFHIVLIADPVVRPAMTWVAFDTKKRLEVSWQPSSMVHDQMMAEINLHPIFQTWRSEDDFRGLLCLVVVLASQSMLGGPYNHRIPIAQECRGQLTQMLGKIIRARRDMIMQREREDNSNFEAAKALLSLCKSPAAKLESLAGLRRAMGADPGTFLFGHPVNLIHKPNAEPEFVSIGVHIGVATGSIPCQQGQPVFAFISPQQGNFSTAPLMLTINDKDKQDWRLLSNLENGFAAAMAQVQPTSAFSKMQSAEDLLALVSLAIIMTAEQRNFGIVNHRIPVIPWCRGHLALMMRRAMVKLYQGRQKTGHGRESRQDPASRQPLSGHTGDRASEAAAASSQAMLLNRSSQVIEAQMRSAERMFVWLSQNDEARGAMNALLRNGKIDSREFRDLQAAVSSRETQMRHSLESGMFPLIGISQDLNRQLLKTLYEHEQH